ncbi:zinc transporter ZupT [Sinanaerobacter sp. ZZT-01]|uniref:zinc transporter ZupT n=1 Tax=Sinanaerobacter sp. ZZT-01 TaxID=3111540 RepID=UPI002D79797D|nr:zinc transporter ZupT [Sinanaerobacter sp. ZZT-01]WRR92377.1 zinc transporter ZupT [Sinanaerobacter sp. ZZT-01]
MNHVGIAFILTAIAGLSTGIGSCIAFFAKKTNTKFLSVSLGFSAGVMIYVSMLELLTGAMETLSVPFGKKTGTLLAIVSFFGGMAVIAIIDKLIPEEENPHSVTLPETADQVVKKDHKLMRTGLLTALAIGIHNFPEGLATFISALQEPSIAIPIVVAISIHNIPEGIAVSMPIYYASGDKKKAFWYSFASGLSEPLGAVIGYLLLMPIMNDTVNGVLFAVVSGIMVFISFDELLPAAREYGEEHLSIYGLIGGMAVMAISLWLFM